MTPRRLAVLLALAALPGAAFAQDSTVVVPGPEYAAGSTRAFLLGTSYRDLWTTPVRVPLLNLGTFAGGLTPTERGGGNQTVSLRFRGADGKEYAFRSVNKRQWRAQEADLEGTVVGRVLQDQVSSQQPSGLVVSGRLMDATGALHVDPVLFVMPNDPRLGQYRQEFAGMLGTVEERPEAPWAGAAEIEGTDDMLEALEEGPRNRLADEEFLTVRLLDLVMNDWDRHADQYRWAGIDSGGVRTWRPIPRDRDYVFVDYDGFLIGLARSALDKAVAFGPAPETMGLVDQGIEVDRRMLGELDRADWDSVTAALRARLTDPMIAQAVRLIPAEHCALRCEQIERTLRARRDALPASAAEFYALLAREPQVYGTDEAETVVVDHRGDSLEVRIHLGTGGALGEPHFRRRFAANETREVRVWMHGGDDRAVVRGQGPILVRLLGGGGDDVYENESRGARTVIYDDRGQNRFPAGPGVVVDTREYEALGAPRGEGIDPPRDWGASSAVFAPYAAIRPYADLVVGGGPSHTRYGFRRYPWATRWWARGLWAPLYGRFGVEAFAARRSTGSAVSGGVFARASDLEATAFYGFGNDTPRQPGLGRRDYIVWERQLLVEPTLVVPFSERFALTTALVGRYTDPEVRPGTPAAALDTDDVHGTESFFDVGARGAAYWEGRDDLTYPRRGFTLAANADVFPGVAGALFDEADRGGFARAGGVGTAYLSAGRGPVLALRAGAQATWGYFPIQYSSFVGGSPSLRGHAMQRFAGDRAAFGGAELRTVLTRANLLVRGDLGVIALADAGRVWYGGGGEGGWHTALGAGVFFRFRQQAVSVVYARGEDDVVYLRMGLPF
jgi:hypothetical protein